MLMLEEKIISISLKEIKMQINTNLNLNFINFLINILFINFLLFY